MHNLFLCMMALLVLITKPLEAFQGPALNQKLSYDSLPEVLPGTAPLTWQNHLSDTMMWGAHRLIEAKIDQSAQNRSQLWNYEFGSKESYQQSIEPNRRRFMQYIGITNSEVDTSYSAGPQPNIAPVTMQKVADVKDSEVIAETSKYRIYRVRWPVLKGVYGDGLLIQPKVKPVANIIAIPDADQTPEQVIGLAPGIPAESQFARRLGENGFQVLVPLLISRSEVDLASRGKQTYREWIYRQAFHMGRHIIGYEVQKIKAAVDWFKASDSQAKVGVAGYCEGGLIAFYAAAVDTRIEAVMVSGYFDSRQRVWDEPIYRNVWGLLTEFGDAELASLIAPRALIVEHSKIPEELERATAKPVPYLAATYTGYKGSIKTPEFEQVQQEFNRIDDLLKPDWQQRTLIAGGGNIPLRFGSQQALEEFASQLGHNQTLAISAEVPEDNRTAFDPESRQMSQVKEIEDHIQWLLRDSDYQRNRFFLYQVMPEFGQKKWSTKSYHPYFSPESFIEQGKTYRTYFWEEVLGKFYDHPLPPNARTRKIYDRELWTGFEVVLDVHDSFVSPGVILIPKDIQPGERRPVVVTQHGRNGVPQTLIEGNTSYYNMAAKLADQGFVVYVPNGLFRGEDQYRWLDRKANTLKKTLFSFIIAQHQQMLEWLGGLEFVDKDRIAFYGKSYGGETAMRVPAVLEGYCLSICSADFGDWSRKVADTHYYNSFMNTIEWEMPYFNMGSTFSYAEMAYLIFPRPFMVERGRHDLVQPDEWVGYEYAKVAHLYHQFNMLDKTEIEFFNGGHASRNDGTFDFLHKHLNWP